MADEPGDPSEDSNPRWIPRGLGGWGANGGAPDDGDPDSDPPDIDEPVAPRPLVAEAAAFAAVIRASHAYVVPAAAALPGREGVPASVRMGFAFDLAVQACVALRLLGESGKGVRFRWWLARASRWVNTVSEEPDPPLAGRLALETLARVASDDASQARVARLVARFDLPRALPARTERAMSQAVESLASELSEVGLVDERDALVPASSRADGYAARERARRWLCKLESSNLPDKRDNWRTHLFRAAVQQDGLPRLSTALGSPPKWKVVLDAARILCDDSPALAADQGNELDRWHACFSDVMERSAKRSPGTALDDAGAGLDVEDRARADAAVHPTAHGPDVHVAPPAGNDFGRQVAVSIGLARVLRGARTAPVLAAELHARLFLRVLLSELFIDAGNEFEQASRDKFFRPLLALVARAEADPRFGAAAIAVGATLKTYRVFGGSIPLDESVRDWLWRIRERDALASKASFEAQLSLFAAEKRPADHGWLDCFQPANFVDRAVRLAAGTKADAEFVARLNLTHDLALLVADAMRDLLFQAHWAELAVGGDPPSFSTLQRLMDNKVKESQLAPHRRKDRALVVGIAKRLADRAFVARIRAVVGELSAGLSRESVFPNPPSAGVRA